VSFARPSHSRESGNPLRKLWKCAVVGLDSRFRGNDRRLEWIPIPNDISTDLEFFLVNLVAVGVWVEASPALEELRGGVSRTGKYSGYGH